MTSQQVTEKREISLAEILVVVTLVALLMVSFIFYFFKHQGQLTQAGFESVSHVFSARVNGLHAQWFMDSQPKFVVIKSNLSQQSADDVKVPVNRQGWVDVQKTALRCQKIWQYVMESPLIYMKQPVGAVLVASSKNKTEHYCQFSLPSGEYFTYQSANGNVNFNPPM